MAYRIQYDRVGKRRIFDGFVAKRIWLIAAAVCILLFFIFAGNGFDTAAQSNDATAQAFYVLVEDLREGTALSHALEVFCQSVLEGANVQK